MIKMKLIIAGILLIAAGCSQEKGVTESEKDSDELFSEQCRLLSVAADSMARCSDSLTIAEVHTHLEEAMAEAAMKHSPQVHLKFSEGKNDTIMRLTDAYLREYKKAIERLQVEQIPPEAADSGLQMKSAGAEIPKEIHSREQKPANKFTR